MQMYMSFDWVGGNGSDFGHTRSALLRQSDIRGYALRSLRSFPKSLIRNLKYTSFDLDILHFLVPR